MTGTGMMIITTVIVVVAVAVAIKGVTEAPVLTIVTTRDTTAVTTMTETGLPAEGDVVAEEEADHSEADVAVAPVAVEVVV